jgi:hypothetical protein
VHLEIQAVGCDHSHLLSEPVPAVCMCEYKIVYKRQMAEYRLVVYLAGSLLFLKLL